MKHQKAWKQEIRQEQNSNLLQRNSYVHFHFREINLAVFHAISNYLQVLIFAILFAEIAEINTRENMYSSYS